MKHTVEVMISEQEVHERVQALGKAITEHYKGSEDLVMVGLLRGFVCIYGRPSSCYRPDTLRGLYDGF